MRVHIYGMNDNITVFDFSGIYNEESFYHEDKSSRFCIINCRNIPGTNCMCDDDAIAQIREKIRANALEMAKPAGDNDCEEYFAKGIHFNDKRTFFLGCSRSPSRYAATYVWRHIVMRRMGYEGY